MRKLLLLVAGLLLAAPNGAGAATHSVAMTDHAFWSLTAMSSAITVRAGDTVIWENRGDTYHNAQASDGSWQTPNLSGGESASRVFDVPGEYLYVCSLHVVEEMTGTVIVLPAQTPVLTRRVLVPLAQR